MRPSARAHLPVLCPAATRTATRRSYNAVNGVPSCANSRFQNDVVRGEWGWDGYIVSDCGAIGDIKDPHKYTKDDTSTVAAALRGGTDLECDSTYKKFAAQALSEGLERVGLPRPVERLGPL